MPGSHFLRGKPGTLNALLGDLTRLLYQVVVVQPGLSTTPKDTAADAYHWA